MRFFKFIFRHDHEDLRFAEHIAQIAAFSTRNVADYDAYGVKVINPWEA